MDIRKKMWKPESYKNSAHGIYSLSAGGCPASSCFLVFRGLTWAFPPAGVSYIPFARFKLNSFSTRKYEYPIKFNGCFIYTMNENAISAVLDNDGAYRIFNDIQFAAVTLRFRSEEHTSELQS